MSAMYLNPQQQQMLPPQQRPVAPETFLLDQDAQQSLPADSVVALQQVDNRMSPPMDRNRNRIPSRHQVHARIFTPDPMADPDV